MRELELFRKFFHQLWGYLPYPWQEALLQKALKEEWPRAVVLPTGSGKTATLDVAVFLMAFRPEAHRRVVYLVNRRVVVDQAEERALSLAQRLREALEEDSPLGEVARRLRDLGGGEPLRVIKLRGGLPLPRHPVDDPAAPTVVLSTLDQVGSRLLFRGYGLSSRAWPVEAGLLGVDTLYLLDEAHLEVPAFRLLLNLEKELRGVREILGRPALRVVALTATPETLGSLVNEERLEPTLNDEEHLQSRWGVRKPLRLALAKTPGELPKVLAKQAQEFRKATGGSVIVFCNRVSTAREVHNLLEKTEKGRVLLVTGRARPFDRDQLLGNTEELQVKLDQGEIAYVISTQALEVGANLDAGSLVTELAPIDALFQRLGRAGRRGFKEEAPVAVVWVQKSSPRPYAQENLEAAWRWLESLGEGADLGILGLRKLRETAPIRKEAWDRGTEVLPVPPQLLRFLTFTDPYIPNVEVEKLLHGNKPTSPEVYLAFRKDLEWGEKLLPWENDLADFLLPPNPYELLPLPLWAARAFLERRESEDISDIEVEEAPNKSEDKEGSSAKTRVLRFTGEGVDFVEPKDIEPGNILLVPARLGGIDSYGYNPEFKEPVLDVGEARPFGARPPKLIRLHPEVLQDALVGGFSSEDKEALAHLRTLALGLRDQVEWWETQEAAETLASVLGIEKAVDLGIEGFFRQALRVFLERIAERAKPLWKPTFETALSRFKEVRLLAHPEYPGLVLRLPGENFSLGGEQPQGLEEHQEEVRQKVLDFARRLDLPENLQRELEEAARHHDYGKRDPRMQLWLSYTAPRGALPQRFLAKSGTQLGRCEIERLREEAGYPKGQRHELVGAASLEGRLSPLALHLVATHHGHGRPLPKAVEDPYPEVVDEEGEVIKTQHGLDRVDGGHLERFLELSEGYTPWGLAYLEAFLRLADQKASEEIK